VLVVDVWQLCHAADLGHVVCHVVCHVMCHVVSHVMWSVAAWLLLVAVVGPDRVDDRNTRRRFVTNLLEVEVIWLYVHRGNVTFYN